MNGLLPQIYYVGVAGAIVTLFLATGLARAGRAPRGPGAVLAVLAAGYGLCFVPVNGLPLWRSAFAFWSNPSLPFVALIVAALVRQLGGRSWLPSPEGRTVWRFGALMGTLLYLHVFLPGTWDIYFWGWNPAVFDLALAVVAVAFLAFGRRFGVVLAAAVVAAAGGWLESANGWDYVVDPIFWLISLGVLGFRLGRRLRRGAPALVPPAVAPELETARSG